MASEPGAKAALERTPLHDLHAQRGVKFTGFSGFEMPVQFDSILQEHEAVRERVGLFDVSHMSNLEVPGAQAEELSSALGADVTQLEVGRARYTVALREDATILDDVIVFHLADRFHVVPNAGMNEIVGEHLRRQGCRVADRSQATCILALQGPEVPSVYTSVLQDTPLPDRFQAIEIADGEGFASGTGYTGERGVEFVVPAEGARVLWEAFLAAGVQPCGLGARNTLRLEKGYALAGNEFDPPVTPVEAKLLWTVDQEHGFVGRTALSKRLEAGPERVLAGVKLAERGVPRRGFDVLHDGEVVGRVSSGTMSPSLDVGIGLAYIPPALDEAGTEVEVDIRGRPKAATIEEVPFL